MKDILKKARQGNAKAQLTVALNYIWGSDGFTRNERQARIWYEKAALNGNLEAMFNLGTMELNGEGGKTDLAQGIEWIKKAANSKRKHIYSETAPTFSPPISSSSSPSIWICLRVEKRP